MAKSCDNIDPAQRRSGPAPDTIDRSLSSLHWNGGGSSEESETMGSTTAFSFHCMICFEEFHPEDRYPVVLPCGHTYVCHLCANRLDKCMECRTPLYELVQPPKMPPSAPLNASPGQHYQASRSSWTSARSGGGQVVRETAAQAFPPPQPPVKRRLAPPRMSFF